MTALHHASNILRITFRVLDNFIFVLEYEVSKVLYFCKEKFRNHIKNV
jgi:hypothetical protein